MHKNLIISSTILLIMCGVPIISWADEIKTTDSQQAINDNRAIVAVQKQPAIKTHKQEAKQNKFCIIVQINGKIKDVPATSSK